MKLDWSTPVEKPVGFVHGVQYPITRAQTHPWRVTVGLICWSSVGGPEVINNVAWYWQILHENARTIHLPVTTLQGNAVSMEAGRARAEALVDFANDMLQILSFDPNLHPELASE